MDKTSFNSAKQAALRKYFSRMNEMQQEAVFTVNGPCLFSQVQAAEKPQL